MASLSSYSPLYPTIILWPSDVARAFPPEARKKGQPERNRTWPAGLPMQSSPPQAGAQIGHVLHRDHGNPIVEMIRPGSGIDDPEVFELEIMEGHTHRARRPGGVGNLEIAGRDRNGRYGFPTMWPNWKHVSPMRTLFQELVGWPPPAPN